MGKKIDTSKDIMENVTLLPKNGDQTPHKPSWWKSRKVAFGAIGGLALAGIGAGVVMGQQAQQPEVKTQENSATDVFKQTDLAAEKTHDDLKENMAAAIDAKTKSYTDKEAAKGLNEKIDKAEASVKKLESLDADYQANVIIAKDAKKDIPEMKHLHKNEAQAYRNILESIKNPSKESVQDKAIKSFSSVMSFKITSKNTAVQDELHKTYDSKLNGMLSAKLEADKKAQQSKDAATKAKQDAQAKKQQSTQNQAPAQSAPQQNNGGGQSYSNGGGNSYGGGGQSYGGGTSSGQRPYNPPAQAPSRPSRPAQSRPSQSQGEWQVKPSEKTDANGNYISGDGSVHNEPDLGQGLTPG